MYFVLLGERNPHEYVIHTMGKTFSFPQEEHVLKRAQVISVKCAYEGNLLLILAKFFEVSRGEFFGKSLAKSEWIAKFQPGKNSTNN